MPALTTLMPPVVDTFQKAFIYTKNMRIYFSPSSFNSFSTSWKVHVTVRNQKNNENAINLENYPNGIIVYSYNKGYYYDSKKKMYYLDVAPTMLADTSEFLINQYYKVQLRFDECPTAYMQSGQIYDKINYMINNLAYFSEWSTVTLIKPISKPELDIEQFVEDPLEVNWGTLRLTGSLNFVDALGNTINTKETERLYSYKIYF